jgi:hypothetical protein
LEKSKSAIDKEDLQLPNKHTQLGKDGEELHQSVHRSFFLSGEMWVVIFTFFLLIVYTFWVDGGSYQKKKKNKKKP